MEDVHRGTVCSVCPGCLQQGKKIQSTQPSAEHKSDLEPAFDRSAQGNGLYSDVMNLQ
jgi:hypothetical protein